MKVDYVKAYVSFINISRTVDYKRKMVWFLDRHRPDIADKVRAKLPDELRNLVKTCD